MLALVLGPGVMAQTELETQGEYLARAGNCISCHSTERGKPFAGGFAFETEYGLIYSTNITPDPKTGIGAWTLEDFTAAMRRGERPDGEHLYPVFPYTSFTKVSDDDIAAIYAYLKTLTPVTYTPPENELSFPYDQRWALGIWKSLFLEEGEFQPPAGAFCRLESWRISCRGSGSLWRMPYAAQLSRCQGFRPGLHGQHLSHSGRGQALRMVCLKT